MFQQELYETTFMKDLMTIPPSYIDKKENIETVMEAFRKTGAWNLPVLDNGYYVGFISKSRIFIQHIVNYSLNFQKNKYLKII